MTTSTTREAARPTQPQLVLGDGDFKAGPGSRDPFHRLLNKPDPPAPGITCDKGKLGEYGLDELKLTGIVGGGTRPLAMFRGPTSSTSTTVKRGDRIGKTCGRVTAILRDRVIVAIQVAGSNKQAERVIPLHTS